MKNNRLFNVICRCALVVTLASTLLSSVGCDQNRLDVLVVGVSTIDASYADIEKSCDDWAENAGANVQVVAPALPTAAEQQKVLEAQLQQDWDVICIEPLGVAELAPLLESEKDKGTKIITLRGHSYPVADYNIEPFSTYQMGQQMMQVFAKAMNNSGSYATLVPSFEAPAIMDTENAAIQLQKQQFGSMLLADRMAVTEGKAENAKEIVLNDKEYYGINGVMFFTSTDGLGIVGQTTAQGERMISVGLGDIKVLQSAVESGDIDCLFYWDRINHVLAGLEVGRLVAEGNTLDPASDSISLNIEGYETFRHLSDNTWVGTDIRSLAATQ
jgi:ABC-type sugar transport system substrate-binding protein